MIMPKLYLYNYNQAGKLSGQVILRELPDNKTILLISPHSDDIAVSLGGTVNLLAKNNKIIPLLLFSGWRGVEGAGQIKGGNIREQEMIQESKILGVKKPIFLNLPSYEKDDKTTQDKDILEIEQYLKKYQPDIIFLPRANDYHPRHRLAANMALKAISRRVHKKAIELFFYETPWRIFGNFDFNAVFVLSKIDFAQKIKAIRAHQSQIKRNHFDKIVRGLNDFRASVIPEQRIGNYGSSTSRLGQYIEVFYNANYHS